MENFDIKVGFSRIDITPPNGVEMPGYFIDRFSSGVIDNLEINAVAIQKDLEPIFLVTLDNEGAVTRYINDVKDYLEREIGVKKHNVFIQSTHSHTSGRLDVDSQLSNEVDKNYSNQVKVKIGKAIELAYADLKPAKMGVAVSKAEKIGFNRRYLMKDGSVKTNPGVNNPDIVKAIGLLDERLNVIRFLREDGSNIILANYGNHPDTVGGDKISGDWPTLSRRTTERALENAKCVFFNGALGDINHVNVQPKENDLNDMILDFDDVSRGYSHTKHMANVVAGGILSVYEKVLWQKVDGVKGVIKTINIPSNMPKKEELENAHYVVEMHKAGKDSQLPYEGMMLTTVVAEALRMVKYENGPEFLPLNLHAIKIGDVAFLGIPGEPFTGVGMGLKESKEFSLVCPCSMANGNDGYFPMQDSYDEGGYEARSSEFKPGVAELIIKEGLTLLSEINK